MRRLEKVLLLTRVAFREPMEFFDRFEAIITSRWEKWFGKQVYYPVINPNEVIARITNLLKSEIADYTEEIETFESELTKRMQTLEGIAPFTTAHHADFSLARLCYTACRTLKPDIVLETGVAYGVTTAFILKALQLNDRGVLHSIDLPPLGKSADNFVGYLVPEGLKVRWILHRGVSKRLLPTLLPQIKKVDIFIHDSLHTYWNIRGELQLITPYLSRPAMVIADDVHNNTAFQEWISKTEPKAWWTFQEEKKDSIAGIAVFL